MIIDHRTRALSAPASRAPRTMRGFDGYGNFGGSWEDYCDQNYPVNSEFWKKCRVWSICGGPDTDFGKSCRGLPAGVGNVLTDIVGSVIAVARPPLDSEFEPMNLFRASLYDPARFVLLSGYSNIWPAALKRGGMLYMSMFTISPQMFIPGVGGFWLAMDDAKKKGGEEYATTQVLDALIGKIPGYIGFVIDFLLIGWGALAKKCIQLHADNMPEGDGKQLMAAIARNYGAFADAINDPSSFTRKSIYISIGESMLALGGSGNDVTRAIGNSLVIMAPALEASMTGNFTDIPILVYDGCFTTIRTSAGPVSQLKPAAADMLRYSSRAVHSLIDVIAEIKIADIGPKFATAANRVLAEIDNAIATLATPAQIQQVMTPVSTAPGRVDYSQPPTPAPVPKSDAWKKAAIGAGTGLVIAGPPGAIGGAGIALMMNALKKGTS